MNKGNIVLIAVALICTCIAIWNFKAISSHNSVIGSGSNENVLSNEPLLDYVPYQIASYEYYERYLYLSDFTGCTIGTTTDSEIVRVLGERNGVRGTGFLWPYYQLVDSSSLLMYFDYGEFANLGILLEVTLIDRHGNAYNLRAE